MHSMKYDYIYPLFSHAISSSSSQFYIFFFILITHLFHLSVADLHMGLGSSPKAQEHLKRTHPQKRMILPLPLTTHLPQYGVSVIKGHSETTCPLPTAN